MSKDAFQRILDMSASSQLAQMANKISSDFLFNGTGFLNEAWYQSSLSGGSSGVGQANALHPGVVTFKSHASNANSGMSMISDIFSIILGGGENFIGIFKTSAILNGVTRRIGFHDATSITAPIDGVYIEIVDGVVTGKTASNSTIATTSTDFTLSANTWYRILIEISPDASEAYYKLYADNSDTLLLSDKLTVNGTTVIIPTGSGRWVSSGDVCTLASPSSVVEIGHLDYLEVNFSKARKVR